MEEGTPPDDLSPDNDSGMVVSGSESVGDALLVEGSQGSAVSSSNQLNGRRRCFDEAFPSGSDDSEAEELLNEETHVCPKCSSSVAADATKQAAGKVESKGYTCEAHPGCLKTFATVREYEEHYNLRHRHKCNTCKKSLPSAHILELHVLEAHDTLFSLMAEKRPMLACFLESCTTVFWKSEQRKEHCLLEHKFPKSFKLWELSNGTKPDRKPGSKPNQKEKGKPKPQSKKDLERMQTESPVPPDEVSSSSDAKAQQPNETMEIDTSSATVGGTHRANQRSSSLTNNGKSSNSEKASSKVQHQRSVPNQITFGHSASRAFKPKYSFGLTKPVPDEGVSSSSSCVKMDLDMSDIKDVLPTATSISSISSPSVNEITQ